MNSVLGQVEKAIEVVCKKEGVYRNSTILYKAKGQTEKYMEKLYYNFKMEQFLREMSKKEILKKDTSHFLMEVSMRVGLKIFYSTEKAD